MPYGYRLGAGGRLVDIPDERGVIPLIQGLRATGMSLRQISRELETRNTLNHPSEGANYA